MRVLLVEDDTALAAVLLRGLSEEGWTVGVARDGEEGLAKMRERNADAVILDGGLPRLDGFEVLRIARASGVTTPVLILTARDATEDRVRGLDLGADDYLVKPFAFEELLARLRAILRRHGTTRPVARLRHGDVEIVPAARRVLRGDASIELSAIQFNLLLCLLGRRGAVVSREEILREVWDYDFDPGTNVVDVHIASLRNKIDVAGAPSLIRTVRGVGYTIDEE